MDKKKGSSVLTEYSGDIAKLFKKVKKSTEFEIDFNMDKTSSISYEKYVSLMEYLTYRKIANKLEILKSITLDVNFSQIIGDEIRENYRITISGREFINKYVSLLQSKNNHVIFNTLLSIAQEGKNDEYITVYKKVKLIEDTYDIPDLNVRIRLADETILSKKDISKIERLTPLQQKMIAFRLKQRISVILEKTKDYTFRIDLTTAKTAYNIIRLEQLVPRYEMELEYYAESDDIQPILPKILDEAVSLLKVIQKSNYIITKTQTERVFDEYRRLMDIGDKKLYAIEGRQPVSLEIQHVSDLFNKYAVSDKADGERHIMIIYQNRVYIISNTLIIRDTGIVLKKDEYNGTIFDGEYVFLPKQQRHLFMVFDCLFAKGVDVRKDTNLMNRLNTASRMINECFIFGKQTGFTPDEMKKDINTVNLVKYHTEQLDKFIDTLHHDIPIERKYPLVRTKYFIPATGLTENEIFKYSMVIWNKYMYSPVKYPYMLDGIVYQPLNQAYITDSKLSKLSDYKWKPSENNTIDFYVQFAKNPTTGKILDVYDNSSTEDIKDKTYRICYLSVGKRSKEGVEVPVYFNEDKKLHIALLFLQDGTVKDKEGNIIQDNTVVEFYYNNNLEINERFRWTPLRTRYDKTELVQKYKIRYGNGQEVANRIWRSIMTPVRIIDLKLLSDDESFWKHLAEMKGKITYEAMMSIAKENAYYQIKTNLGKPMRNFHNWIKSIMIYTYASKLYNGDQKCSVLDVGSGVGGDIGKLYHAKIAFCVGIEPDWNNIHNAFDGAIRRYNTEKSKLPAAPKIYYICGDFTVPLNVDAQIAVSTDKTPENRALIEKFFPESNMKQFDCINCQFAFHYFLANDKAWSAACDNIKKSLKPGGYMIFTTYDAQRVLEVLGDNEKYTIYYTTGGEKKILTELVKKFSDKLYKKNIGAGVAIDVYNGLVSTEDTYITEYLVDKDFVIKELDKRCNMELIETDMFDRQFELHKQSIMYGAKYDMNLKTRDYFSKTAEFYDQTDETNAACFKITRLNRLYVFRRRT